MRRRDFIKHSLAGAAFTAAPAVVRGDQRRPPNVVLIVADDLGYGELGCYGQTKIRTPRLDRLAAEGMRFTRFYCGQAVCAPSRCVLMTGKHTGHAAIRDNKEVQPEGQQPLPDSEFTIAEMLKARGYATAAIGKWGLGPPGSSGDPNRQGFDEFFGYNCQRHAHNYYPRYLYYNDERMPLPGNDRGLTGKLYAPDLMLDEALGFIRDNKDRPFFLYYPTTVPHLALQVPGDSLNEYKGEWPDRPYEGKSGYLPHPSPRAAYAAMITRMDRDIGRILDELSAQGLDDDTLVIFSSDNGPTYLEGPDTDFFDSNGPLRGKKGSLYEGGIRVPTIARWKGRVQPGAVSDWAGAFWDVMPTLADLCGGEAPEGIDGVSFAPALLGEGAQPEHDYLYWEFSAYGGQQALCAGEWKAIRQNLTRKEGDRSIQLYNLRDDVGEEHDVAGDHPEIVQRLHEMMQKARVPSSVFPFPALDRES
ncbi:MAG: sulfatase-like hydrolase/transferase [bacterium]|nr:sulfatase-like hydrolase/transferase [bacterium]